MALAQPTRLSLMFWPHSPRFHVCHRHQLHLALRRARRFSVFRKSHIEPVTQNGCQLNGSTTPIVAVRVLDSDVGALVTFSLPAGERREALGLTSRSAFEHGDALPLIKSMRPFRLAAAEPQHRTMALLSGICCIDHSADLCRMTPTSHIKSAVDVDDLPGDVAGQR